MNVWVSSNVKDVFTSCNSGVCSRRNLVCGIIIIMIIIIIIIIIIPVITYMQCIYNYVPETNHVPTVHTVAAALYLQFTVPTCNVISHVKHVLYWYCSTFPGISISALIFQLLIQERRR
jgi:hypothetical protein